MRASFMRWNMTFMPSRSLPRSSPTHLPSSPKMSIAVAEPLMPILCSMPPVVTSFEGPRLPSAFTRNLGTTKIEMPLVPAGSPSMRASTVWMLFGVRS